MNIAVIAPVEPESQELAAIRSRLKNPLRYRVREFLTMAAINEGLGSFPFDVLILWLPKFRLESVALVKKLRLYFPSSSVVIVSPEIDPGARFQIRQTGRLKIISEETELNDLQKVVEVLVAGSAGPIRLHPRVPREGLCKLVDATTGEVISSEFVDFAQMGAQLVLNPRVPLRKGARIQVHYPSMSEPGRTNRIESVVVWTQMKSGMVGTLMNGPTQAIGIRFIAAV